MFLFFTLIPLLRFDFVSQADQTGSEYNVLPYQHKNTGRKGHGEPTPGRPDGPPRAERKREGCSELIRRAAAAGRMTSERMDQSAPREYDFWTPEGSTQRISSYCDFLDGIPSRLQF